MSERSVGSLARIIGKKLFFKHLIVFSWLKGAEKHT